MLGKIDYGVMSITPSLGGQYLAAFFGHHPRRPPRAPTIYLGAVLALKQKRR
jgi:hypothetical protein